MSELAQRVDQLVAEHLQQLTSEGVETMIRRELNLTEGDTTESCNSQGEYQVWQVMANLSQLQQSQLEAVQEQLAHKESQLESVKKELKETRQQLSVTRSYLDESRAQVTLRVKQSNEIEESLEEEKKKVAKVHELMVSKEQQIDRIVTQRQELYQKYEETKQELRQVKDNNYEVMVRIQQQKHAFECEVVELRKQKAQRSTLCNDQAQLIKKLQESLKQAQSNNQNLKKSLDRELQKISNFEKEVSFSKNNVEALQVHNTQLKQDLMSIKNQQGSIMSELSHMVCTHSEMAQLLHHSYTTIERLTHTGAQEKSSEGLKRIVQENIALRAESHTLQLRLDEANALVKQMNSKSKLDASVQSQQLSGSRIRRQNFEDRSPRHQRKSSHSHSLLSIQKEKQNRRTITKIKAKEECAGEGCRHRQRIVSLNHIINYMLDYCKGYLGGAGGFRTGSWAEHNPRAKGNSVGARREILEAVGVLCQKEEGCRCLLKELETVMRFYFRGGSSRQWNSMQQ